MKYPTSFFPTITSANAFASLVLSSMMSFAVTSVHAQQNKIDSELVSRRTQQGSSHRQEKPVQIEINETNEIKRGPLADFYELVRQQPRSESYVESSQLVKANAIKIQLANRILESQSKNGATQSTTDTTQPDQYSKPIAEPPNPK
ncbi:hypothetical protein [Undibacterium fentianense]|uniref:Uncharacterized protein n=1 Tax=Undibacterium fentianense TaxID=2828728 RepID=A0A941E3X6_9BURK|nr:hypothetical protein [Undibacterium fentianense]MBR7800652.1 hypothetical protein [Undibacterium fentianense]